MKTITLGACFLLFASSVWSHPSGSPSSACEDMIPMHNVPPQSTASPYIITPSKTTVDYGEKIIITIAAPPDVDFKGFLMQARLGDTPVGVFTTCGTYKPIDCPPGKANAATHRNADPKTFIKVRWIAPSNVTITEPINFYTTVVKSHSEFWVKQPSGSVTLNNN